MSIPSNATTNNQHIEKFKGNFSDIIGGVTVLHTKEIQKITDFFLLGIYTYLVSKPPQWKINIKELMTHGKCGKNKIYKALSDLCLMGFIERKAVRDKGKFVDYEYFVYLSPFTENRESVQPFPQKPFPGKPFPGNRDTYKEEKLPYKEKNIKKEEISKTSTSKPKPPSPTDKMIYEWHKERNEPIPSHVQWIENYLENENEKI